MVIQKKWVAQNWAKSHRQSQRLRTESEVLPTTEFFSCDYRYCVQYRGMEWELGKKSSKWRRNGEKKQAEIIVFFDKTLEQNLGLILSERFFKTRGKKP